MLVKQHKLQQLLILLLLLNQQLLRLIQQAHSHLLNLTKLLSNNKLLKLHLKTTHSLGKLEDLEIRSTMYLGKEIISKLDLKLLNYSPKKSLRKCNKV
jgi:hypothetical protein